MPVESDADRAGFLSPDEFGVVAQYFPRAGGQVDVNGIFNNPPTQVAVGDEVMTTDSVPTFICETRFVPASARAGDDGDQIKIGATRYRVLDLQPDGMGLTLITLGAR